MSKLRVDQIQSTQHATSTIDLTSSGAAVNGDCSATTFTGDGSNLTNIPVDLTNLDAANLSSGTIPDDRFPATLPAISGANLTGVSAGALEYVTEQRVLGSNTPTYLEFDETVIEQDQEYLMIGFIYFNSGSGPRLCIDTEMKDTGNNTYQYRYGYNSCYTKTYGATGYTNQSSSYWYIYDGGWTASRINFQMRLSTKKYPRMQFWGHGVGNSSDAYYMVEANGWWQNNAATTWVNKFRFADDYSGGFQAPTHITLFKYKGGYWS